MTAQELFDQVVAHLRKQNSKSLLTERQCQDLELPFGSCAYRSQDGKKCAVGATISDEEYSPRMEGTAACYAIDYFASLQVRLGPHIQLLTSLQSTHDRLPVEEWEHRFQELAEFYHLVYTRPETHT